MTKEDIGAILKQLRLACSMTQKEVAEKIGRKQQIVGHWETGYAQPDADTLFTLCKIYGTTIDEAFGFTKKKTDISPSEYEHIKKYRNLDDCGKEHVGYVLEWETKRIIALSAQSARIAELEYDQGAKEQTATLIELHPYRNNVYPLPYFRGGISAGSGVFVLGNEATEKIEIPDIPEYKGTDYAVDVNGKSMEPDYMDGDIVLVSQKKEMHPGDVGIFIVDGSAYIKELGHTELISRNKDFPNISIQESNNVVCMGKVIGKLERNKK